MNITQKPERQFFPKGATALIVLRGLYYGLTKSIELSDYIREIGKEASTKERKIYRQRRNRVRNHALECLIKYELVERGQTPRTYNPTDNFLGYLKFLKDYIPDLYKKIDFNLGYAVLRIFNELEEAYQRIYGSIISAWLEKESSMERSMQLEGELASKHIPLLEDPVYRNLMKSHDPVMPNEDQVKLLKTLFSYAGMNEDETRDAIFDIVMDYGISLDWLNKTICGITGSCDQDFSFVNIEGIALRKVMGDHQFYSKFFKRSTNPRETIFLDSKEPWWLVMFSQRIRNVLSPGNFNNFISDIH